MRDVESVFSKVWFERAKLGKAFYIDWISVHDRTPEEVGTYLVTYEYAGRKRKTGTAIYKEVADESRTNLIEKWGIKNVIAWAYMPEPFVDTENLKKEIEVKKEQIERLRQEIDEINSVINEEE